jgi:hypothetical protein
MEGHAKSVRLPKRSKVIVEMPVDKGEDGDEGPINKLEIAEGIYLASSLTKIVGNRAITSILNTRHEDAVTDIPCVRWEKYTPDNPDGDDCTSYVGAVAPVEGKFGPNRDREVIAKLRLDHLNTEEKQIIENTCRDYQDIFYLEGDRLSCRYAVKHSIN